MTLCGLPQSGFAYALAYRCSVEVWLVFPRDFRATTGSRRAQHGALFAQRPYDPSLKSRRR
jgi:hypothetical protein